MKNREERKKARRCGKHRHKRQSAGRRAVNKILKKENGVTGKTRKKKIKKEKKIKGKRKQE